MVLDGRKLNIIRVTQGKSIRQLASDTGCGIGTIQRALHGKDVWDLNAAKIAKALNTNLEDLLVEEGV